MKIIIIIVSAISIFSGVVYAETWQMTVHKHLKDKEVKSFLSCCAYNVKLDSKNNVIYLNLSDYAFNNRIYNRPIPAVPFEKLIHVVDLFISCSEITPEISALKKLETIMLRKCVKMPKEIGSVISLKSIKVHDGSLKTLPPEIGNLVNLEELYISNGNASASLRTIPLKTLPPEIGNLKNLKKLVLKNNGMRKIPSEIGNLINLTELNLNFNELQEIPSSIGNLKNLTTLLLEYNNIKAFPTELGSLEGLITLNLKSNKIEKIPSEIGGLKNLETLNLFGVSLKSGFLPEEMGNLKKLKFLNLDNTGYDANQPLKVPRSLMKILISNAGFNEANAKGETFEDIFKKRLVNNEKIEFY